MSLRLVLRPQPVCPVRHAGHPHRGAGQAEAAAIAGDWSAKLAYLCGET